MALLKDLTVLGSTRLISDAFGSDIYANKHITNGGLASQFVKGDGTLDSTVYVKTTDLSSILTSVTGGVLSSSGNTLSLTALTVSAGGTSKSNTASTSIPIINSLSVSTASSAAATNLTLGITVNGKASANTTITDLYASYIQTSAGSTNADQYLTFVVNAASTGQSLLTDTDLKYNPSTNTLTGTNATFGGILNIPAHAPGSGSGTTSFWIGDGVWSAEPGGGGGSIGETLTITKGGSSWISYNGTSAVTKDLTLSLAEVTGTTEIRKIETLAASGGGFLKRNSSTGAWSWDTSTYLTSHQTIKQNGITGATRNSYGTCGTAAATAAKTANVTSGTPTLEAGLKVSIKFTYANTANSPTLNINSTGAKNIFHKGAQITSGTNKALLAGVCDFIYDGTQWHLVGNYIDTDTHNSHGHTFTSSAATGAAMSFGGTFTAVTALGNASATTGSLSSTYTTTTYTLPSLPTASASTPGVIKVGTGLSITDGVLSVAGGGASVDWADISNKPSFVNVVNPSTDNAIVRFDGTTGAIQNSVVTIADTTGNMHFGGNAGNRLISYVGTDATYYPFYFNTNGNIWMGAGLDNHGQIAYTKTTNIHGHYIYFVFGKTSQVSGGQTGIRMYVNSMIPTDDNLISLGGAANRWKSFHAVDGYFTNQLHKYVNSSTTYDYTLPNASGTLALTSDIPNVKTGIVVGKLYRNNVNGTGNISITGNAGYIPTTTVAGTYTVAIYMMSTTQSYTMNVTYGSNTYTLSTTNGVISDVRNLTVAANSHWSASIPSSTPVATGTYLVVTLYKQMTTATTIGVAAVTNNYTDLDNIPSIPTVNNATLTIQKNSTTVATFTANASSGVTANITVPTKTSDLTNDSLVPTTRTINGKALSSNITLSLDDVSDGSTRKIYKTITIQSATEGQYTKETLATLFGVNSSDLSLILDGECYIDYGSVKYSPATNRKWDDSSLSIAEYSVVDRDWDLEKWYLNDITILGYGGAIMLIVKTRVSIATEEAVAHMWFTTYSELVTLKNNGNLVPGKWYGINDYEATTTDTESRSNGHKFGILVLATNSDTLSEECLAYRSTDSYYSGSNLTAWKVWYTVDNDTTRFSWADETNGKGVIYRLIDEWGNDCSFDFKSIQFKRYKVTATSAHSELSDLNGLYIGLPTTNTGFTVDTSDYKWFYTFSQLGSDWETEATDGSIVSEKAFSNVITTTPYGYLQWLPNIVMANGPIMETTLKAIGNAQNWEDTVAADNYFGLRSRHASCFGGFYLNGIKQTFRHNIVVGVCRHNSFVTNFGNNTIACFGDMSFNDFKDGIDGNVFHTTGNLTYNTCGSYFVGNTFAVTSMQVNTFTSYAYGNTFRHTGNLFNNVFGPGFYNNTVNCYISYSTFAARFHDNTINNSTGSGYLQSCDFGPNVYNNTFNTPFVSNRLAGQMNNCSFGAYIFTSKFDPLMSYVEIPDGTSSSIFGNIHVCGGVRGTSSQILTLNDSNFRIASMSGTKRHIIIEADTDGKIIATWYSNQKKVGIYKAVADTSWTALPDEIGDINTILNSI